jgi:pyrroline-5-carboxylate reductase
MLREKNLAVIGSGMMGGALACGLAQAGAMLPSRILLYDTDAHKARELAAKVGEGAYVAESLIAAVQGADLILLAVKPAIIPDVLAALTQTISPSQLVLSIAAGIRVETMEALVAPGVPIIRAMPNTPCLVGEGATAVCRGTSATEDHLKIALSLFSSVGLTVEVTERLMDAVTGVSGSGPAYVYLMIEALTDGGVKAGLSRSTARALAAQTVMGSAKMVLETGEHPMQLKDNVTTPGGTTIAAVAALERGGFRIAVIDAVEAAAKRSSELS